MSTETKWVNLEVDEVLRVTEKALLLLIGDDEHWFPKSQLAHPGKHHRGEKNVLISVSEWVVRQEGFEIE